MAINDEKSGANDARVLDLSPNDHYVNIATAKAARLTAEKAKEEAAEKFANEAKAKAVQLATDLETAKTDKSKLEDRIKQMQVQIEGLETNLTKAHKDVERVESYCKKLVEPLVEGNDLNPNCNGRKLTIGVLTKPFTAVDLGKDCGTQPHGWPVDLDNEWQKLTLKRVGTDRHSPWTIECFGRYLGLPESASDGVLAINYNQRNDSQGRAQEWYIGRIKYGWMIHNVQHNLALEMADLGLVPESKTLRGSTPDQNKAGQQFYIVCR